MHKAKETRRLLLATVLATTLFYAPLGALVLHDMNAASMDANDSWQRGLVLAPVAFVASAVVCHVLAAWLLASGHASFIRFTTGACLSAALVILVLAAPAVVIGSYVGMFTLQDAVLPALASSFATCLVAFPAAATWWLIAGRTHNKPIHATCEDARA
jgi:hypothetical protein